MSAFKDQQFSSRLSQMGDQAETAFEEYITEADYSYVRWGLNRPPLNVARLPARLRYAPDYLVQNNFVECQGLGRDQTFKLKFNKWGALHWWRDVYPVEMFVFDSHKHRVTRLDLATLDDLLVDATIDSFHDSGGYFALPADLIFEAGVH